MRLDVNAQINQAEAELAKKIGPVEAKKIRNAGGNVLETLDRLRKALSPTSRPGTHPEVARLTADVQAQASENASLKAQLATATAKIASLPQEIERRAATRSWQILAASGCNAPIPMTAIDKPGKAEKAADGKKGFARVQAAIKEQLERTAGA